MKRIPSQILAKMGCALSGEQRDEMAIPSYLHPNPILRWMAWHRVEVVARLLQKSLKGRTPSETTQIMDYGCGTGILLHECCQLSQRVYGIDPVLTAARILVEQWKLSQVTLLRPEQVADQIAEASLDRILAVEVLEHIQPLTPTLSLLRDKLRKDGGLLVSLPTENALYRLGRRIAGFQGDYHQSNAASVHREIENFGFEAKTIRKIPAAGPFCIYWVAEYRFGDGAADE